MTGRTAYGRASSASLPNSSDSRDRSGSSQIALTNRAPSSAAASSTGVNSAGRGPCHGRSLIASTSSTAIPVSARRRAVWASMAEPGVIGHGRSSSLAGGDPQADGAEPGRGAHRDELGRRHAQQRQMVKPGHPRHGRLLTRYELT